MSGFAVTTRFQVRDDHGRFARRLQAGAERLASDIADAGADVARGLAPWATGELARSIHGRAVGRDAVWSATAPYAMVQEEGSHGPYLIQGSPWLSFDGHARNGRKTVVRFVVHPGVTGSHYMRESYNIVARRATSMMRSAYRG